MDGVTAVFSGRRDGGLRAWKEVVDVLVYGCDPSILVAEAGGLHVLDQPKVILTSYLKEQ